MTECACLHWGAITVIKLTPADHKQLDELIEDILSALQKNELSAAHARDALVRTVTAAAIDDEKEFYDWLDPEYVRLWKRELRTRDS
jgi:hypothetical protein